MKPQTKPPLKSPPSSRGANFISASATAAKNEFGRFLEQVIKGETLIIEKHGTAKAVLVSVETFDALSRATDARLSTLTRRFDTLLDRMQTPQSRRGMKVAFDASPKELGKASLAAARKNEV